MAEMTDEQRRVSRARDALHRDGASPAGALDLLASIVEDRDWENVTDAKGKPFAGFRAFVRDKAVGLDFDPDQLPKVLELRHPRESLPDVAYRMATMRQAVRALLLEEIPVAPAAVHAGPGRGLKTDCATTGLKPDRAETVVSRLKRDDPGMAEQVIRGDLTPNAAALAKGWRKPRIVVSSPAAVAAALRKYMTEQQLAELRELLT
jgi:hypothetical protein